MKTITLQMLTEKVAVRLATGDFAEDLITIAEMLREEPGFIPFNVMWDDEDNIVVSGVLKND